MQSYEKKSQANQEKGLQKCANHHLHTFANKSPLTTPVFHISYPRPLAPREIGTPISTLKRYKKFFIVQ